MFRSLGLLRFAAPLAAVWLLSACTDNGREAPLSQVDTVPPAAVGPQTNQNINNPTLNIPITFDVSPGDALTMVWSDEFDGAALDPETWFFATGDGTEKNLPGWGNSELQYYLPDSAQLVNGVLQITARRETVGGLNYTSARINTEDRFAFKYGRIEASIKLPAGQGLWPAFWMLSQDSPYGTGTGGGDGWAANGEIDILEAINLGGTGGNEIYGTLHHGGEFPANVFTGDTYTPSVDITEDFHTYALEWDATEMRWYFDDTLYLMQNSWSSTAAPFPAPFDQPFHILLNLAVGGNFPGFAVDSDAFPATMEVDWVRVYSGEGPPTEPEAAAPTPTQDPLNVISLFSDAYTDVTVDTFLAGFSAATLEDVLVDGNDTKKYSSLDFAGIEFLGANAIDASGMTHVHLDIWTPDATDFAFKFVDFGGDGFGGGNDSENVPVSLNAGSTPPLTQGNWISIDVSLADLQAAGLTNLTDLNQLIIIGQPSGSATVFVDNLYFYNDVGGSGGTFVNGDFETGDFTGWTLTQVPADRGSITLDSSGQGGRAGTVARLVAAGDATGTNDVLIGQVALAAGTVTPGDSIDVSFDLYGSLTGAGGVVFVEVIFLNGAGVDEGGRDFVGPAMPYTPTGTWTTYSDTVTAGTAADGSLWDVSGGVTLELKAACGAIVGGCGVDASFDNVTFTIN